MPVIVYMYCCQKIIHDPCIFSGDIIFHFSCPFHKKVIYLHIGYFWDYIWAVMKIIANWKSHGILYKLRCRLQWQSNRLLHKHERWRKSYSPKKDQTPLPIFVCYCSLLALGKETTAAQTIYLFIYIAWFHTVRD